MRPGSHVVFDLRIALIATDCLSNAPEATSSINRPKFDLCTSFPPSMLQFAVYDENGPPDRWSIEGAHLIGPDDIPVPGKVRFKDGRIMCEKRGGRAVGLCLLADAGSCGRLMLQTCLLPDRDEPYVLTVELARHRIKTFIAKSEEWQMFDLANDHPAMIEWERARQIFTEAIITVDPVEADRKARQSLEAAIDATERLAMVHAEILLHRRFGTKRASSATLGVRAWPSRNSQPLRDLVGREFDVVMLPIAWREIEVEEGKYNWEPLDRWVQWAKQAGKPIVAGPLLDFSKKAMPDWMYVWQHDYDTCRDMAYDYVERVVQRYRNHVGMWSIASGINTNDNFRFKSEQMFDLARMANLIVRQSRKGARTMIEVAQPFGEHCALANDSMYPLSFLERMVQEGIRVDAIGVQVLCGEDSQGRITRDLMQISTMLDRFYYLEMPIVVSAVSVPSEPPKGDGGWWMARWTPQVQSDWIAKFFPMALSKPFVESIFWGELYDHEKAIIPHGGVISEEGRTKPAMSRLLGLRRRLRKPLGPLAVSSMGEAPMTP
jgi:GH35 family endo-1,4-beta-xylanase